MKEAAAPILECSTSLDSAPPSNSALLGVGCAVPEMCRSQHEAAQEMMQLWDLVGDQRKRFERIIAGCGIDRRHGILPPKDILSATTQRRMELYEKHAPELAERAARAALQDSGVSPDAITDVIVVSCTGYSAPGVDSELVRRLGLNRTVHRTVIGFMGCFGAIIGLRAAMNIVAANKQATVLVVCVELCSLHWRMDVSVQNQVASALFADGAAAAVVGNIGDDIYQSDAASHGSMHGRLMPGRTQLMDNVRELMSWRITDNGFAMTLDARVPDALAGAIGEYINTGVATKQLPSGGDYAIHPGGPSILEAVDDALDLNGSRGIDAAWSILRSYGNMSSATVLFVLRKLLEEGGRRPITLIAFGPGLTIESVGLAREPRRIR